MAGILDIHRRSERTFHEKHPLPIRPFYICGNWCSCLLYWTRNRHTPDAYAKATHTKKTLDRLLKPLRFAKAKPHILKGTHLLNVGTYERAFLRILNAHLQSGTSIDPILTHIVEFRETCRLVPRCFPRDFLEDWTFNIILI